MILIRGAGDIASGVALRLFRSRLPVVMTDLNMPSSIRRTVCFSEALRLGAFSVEEIKAVRVSDLKEAKAAMDSGFIPIFADDSGEAHELLKPYAIVDARLAKVNLDTFISDAAVVIGVGPGFTAGVDCHAVIETQRGHYLGRALYSGRAAENTGIPGNIGGYTVERVIRAPQDGLFHPIRTIGDPVFAGETVGFVDHEPVRCSITGTLRGILPEGFAVTAGFKSGDVDPRCEKDHCFCTSDKALSIGGVVLEGLLHLGDLKELFRAL